MRRRTLTATAAVVAVVSLAGGGSALAAKKPAEQPSSQSPPAVTRARLDAAIEQLPRVVKTAMQDTGVPGVAVAVVWRDEVVFADGFGVREVGKSTEVDADTVFQLASVSKPLGSTVLAALVGNGVVQWDDPVVAHDPTFALADPWVTEHVTIADLYAHRSGLPDHAGDLLEDLGYDREEIVARLRLEPLAPFRDNYDYTNAGLTEAAVAAAKAAGTSWEDLSARLLYEPLGMVSTSSRYEDFVTAPNRAVGHVLDGKRWVVGEPRNADAQSPAGGASSSVADMATWMRLQLANGEVDGERVVDEAALIETHTPQQRSSGLAAPGARPAFYGLGWNVGTDALGRLTLGHSGAFALGAATAVNLLPSERLGIITLTNGAPIGLAEAVNLSFLDLATYGRVTVDWLPFLREVFARTFVKTSEVIEDPRPSGAAAPLEPSAYVGTYANPYYGPLTVAERAGRLVMTIGPEGQEFPLDPYDGNTFAYQTRGENAWQGPTAARFAVVDGVAAELWLEAFDGNGFGTFTRAG